MRALRVAGAVTLMTAVATLAGCAPVAPRAATLPQGRLSTPGQTDVPEQHFPHPTGLPAAVIPVGFQPLALTAISETQFWALGTKSCNTQSCPLVIEHTIDSGQSFRGVAAPPTTFAFPAQAASEQVSDMRFADSANGWAFAPGLWATHDAGAHWRRLDLGAVIQLEPGAGGFVYALVDSCRNAVCNESVLRTVASTDVWTDVLDLSGAGAISSIGVHGFSLWVMFGSSLWVSHDVGRTFTAYPAPCLVELGGNLTPVSDNIVWAFCPTGNQGRPRVSTDGGARWSSEALGATTLFGNGGSIAGLSARSAFVTFSSAGGLAFTADGGKTYRGILDQIAGSIDWVGFTDAVVGYALAVKSDGGGELLRTADAGVHWALVRFPVA